MRRFGLRPCSEWNNIYTLKNKKLKILVGLQIRMYSDIGSEKCKYNYIILCELKYIYF